MTNPSATFSLEKRAFLHHKLDDILHSWARKSGHGTFFLSVTDGVPNFQFGLQLDFCDAGSTPEPRQPPAGQDHQQRDAPQQKHRKARKLAIKLELLISVRQRQLQQLQQLHQQLLLHLHPQPFIFLDMENLWVLLPILFSPCPLRKEMSSLLQQLQQPLLPQLQLPQQHQLQWWDHHIPPQPHPLWQWAPVPTQFYLLWKLEMLCLVKKVMMRMTMQNIITIVDSVMMTLTVIPPPITAHCVWSASIFNASQDISA